MENKKDFKILAIDGGGIRGIIPAIFLEEVEKRYKKPFYENFDLICGTSTGCFIAFAAALGINMQDVVALYRDKGSKIFPKPRLGKIGSGIKIFTRSVMYKNTPLIEELQALFQDKKMADLKTRVLIPSSNLSNKSPKTFKSPYNVIYPKPESFDIDSNFLLVDVALASSAAPYYFKPKEVGDRFFWDGGLWANNPSLCGYIEAQRISKENKSIKILSLGTGSEYKGNVAYKKLSKKGPIDPRFVIPYILDIQSEAIEHQLKMLITPNRDIYRRVDCGFTCDMPLDDAGCIQDLIGKAKEMTQNNKTEVMREFFK